MNIFIMLAIAFTNIIAIAIIYQFIKRLPKMDKIIFIIACFAISYITVSIIYWISGFGIDNEVNEAMKSYITYTFVPVNLIILVPFVANKYNKLKLKEIKISEFTKRLVIISIIGIVILTVECCYFKNIKQNISDTQINATLEQSDPKENLEKNYTNEINNEVTNFVITNNIIETELTNINSDNTISKNNVNINVANEQ